MKIILLDDVEQLGIQGSEVIVRPGYARNFLFPKGKAILSTKKNIDFFKEKQFVKESKLVKKQEEAKFYAEKINELGSVTIKARASAQGKLFGSVGTQYIAKVITESVGFKIYKSQIKLSHDTVLKFTGVYNVRVNIYGNVCANLDVKIISIL